MSAASDSAPDGDRPSASLRELQLVELGILLDVQTVCDQLGLRFFLGEGTLLGAVRHEGFIPWDDDVDLFMLRDDYQRFLHEAPRRLGDRYHVQHSSTVPNYWSPVIKVRLVAGQQRFRQTSIAHLTRDNGPLLDIFPLDYVARDRGLLIHLQSAYIRLLRGLLVQKLRTRPANSLLRRAMRLAATVAPASLLHSQLDWAHRFQGPQRRPYLASLATYHSVARQVYSASAFDESAPATFEGHTFPIPAGYDQVLTTTYGDYRQLPPPEQRRHQHEFTV